MSKTKLPLPIGRVLDDGAACDSRELQDVWRAVEARRSGASWRARRWHGALALTAVAVVLALASLEALRSRSPRPLELAAGGTLPLVIAPSLQFYAVDLSDGSRITVARGAQLEILESSATKLMLALRHGRARFDVRPHGPRAWQVACAGVTVQVVGTSFVVERTQADVQVSVERGTVLVSGEAIPDRVQRLSAGERLSTRRASPDLSAAPASIGPIASGDGGVADNATPAAPSTWRDAARKQKWRSAWQALRKEGLLQQARRADQIEDLLLLADVARLSGHPEDAITPLERVTEQMHDARAGLAAFTLGRIRLDELDDPARAAADLSRALTLGLPASLEHDARARLVEAYDRAGMSERARAAAADYHDRYPDGRRSEQVERWGGRD